MIIHRLISFCGIFVMCGIAWGLSANRRKLNWRVTGWGIGLQLLLGMFVFRVPAGRSFFVLVNNAVVKILGAASAGNEFVFGRLALPPGATNAAGETSLGFFLAFQAFPAIVFFSALMAILYYCGALPVIIRGFAFVFTKLMRVSGAESLCAASNIFVGIESSLAVRPFLLKMTSSELCTVLTAGMATVASSVLVLYVLYLDKVFPSIAGHMVSASIMSAPAALALSKIICPEEGEPETLGVSVKPHYERERSLFEAIINGANSGFKLVGGIIALLLAVLGLVALLDLLLGAAGWRLNQAMGWGMDWSLKGLLGYLFYPLTLVMGVPVPDAWTVSKIVGQRLVMTEVPGYQALAAALAAGTLQGRSAVIAAYALCGFAHVASLAIFVGGVSALVPSRAGDLARVGVRALVAATLACLQTACVAGIFAGDSSILLQIAQ